jgi:hypothetical protein
MALLGQDAVRRTIIVNNGCLQQVRNFKYLGCKISYENEKDIEPKLANFAQKMGILNRIFKRTWAQKSSSIKVYNSLVLTCFLLISFSSLSYDRSKAPSKASSPHSAIYSFLLQMRVSSPFLKVTQ